MSVPVPVPAQSSLQLRNILYATDFSGYARQALPYAEALARKFGACIHLCHVVTPSTLAVSAPEVAPYLYTAEHESSAIELQDMAAVLRKKGRQVQVQMLSGPLHEVMPAVVHENAIDLVIAGTHGHTGMKRFLLGSAVEEICRVAPCPVLTVGPMLSLRHDIRFRNILYATDLSQESRKALPYVAGIAEEYASAVTVLHVLPLGHETPVEKRAQARWKEQEMQSVFGSTLDHVRHEFTVDFGGTADTILRIAAEERAALIVLGLGNPKTIHLRASTPYKIMARAHCPVLTVR
jgi:nucleotide-binding universal stress UspA family protein